MIKVDLDKIITANALKAHLDEILYQTEEEEQIFVVTKKGRPRAAIINVDYLEELTGRSVEDESTEYTSYDKVGNEPMEPPETVNERPEEVKASPTPLSEQPIGPVGATTGDQTPAETNPPEEENLDLPELDINALDSDLEETPPDSASEQLSAVNDQPAEESAMPETPPVEQPVEQPTEPPVEMPVPPSPPTAEMPVPPAPPEATPDSPDTTNEQPPEVAAPVEAPATPTTLDSASEQLSVINNQPTEESAVPETPPVEQPVEQTVEQPTEPPPIEMPVPPASPTTINNEPETGIAPEMPVPPAIPDSPTSPDVTGDQLAGVFNQPTTTPPPNSPTV